MGRSYRARIIGAAASRVRGVFVELSRRRRAGRIQRTGLVGGGGGGGHGHEGKRQLDGQGEAPSKRRAAAQQGGGVVPAGGHDRHGRAEVGHRLRAGRGQR